MVLSQVLLSQGAVRCVVVCWAVGWTKLGRGVPTLDFSRLPEKVLRGLVGVGLLRVLVVELGEAAVAKVLVNCLSRQHQPSNLEGGPGGGGRPSTSWGRWPWRNHNHPW